MGHYDSDYEYDAEQRQKERKAQAKKILSKVKALQIMISSTAIPDRFADSLFDLENWLKVNDDLIGQ